MSGAGGDAWHGSGADGDMDKGMIGMEKIQFTFEDAKESVEFYVLEQTKINGTSYILVTDSAEGDAECLILKERATAEGKDCVYDVVEDDTELSAVSQVFEELLEDVDIEL